MNNRSWLWLFPIAALSLTSERTALAQPRADSSSSIIFRRSKESHRDLPNSPDMQTSQEMMAERLKELNELHQLQDQVQDMLKDPAFRDNLKNQFTEEQLRQLRAKILKGNGLGRDRNWNSLLDQALSQRKLDQRQIDILRRWAERPDTNRLLPPTGPAASSGSSGLQSPPSMPGSGSSRPGESPPAPESPESSFWDRLQKESSAWLSEHMSDFVGDVTNALAELGAADEGGPLADVLRSMKPLDSNRGFQLPFTNEGDRLWRYLPKMSEFLHGQRGSWDAVKSLFRVAHLPSLPGSGGRSSLSGALSGGGDHWGRATAALLGLAVLLLLIWKRGGWPSPRGPIGPAGAWRLGPWPVLPALVSTRQDLVRAFEHLALLALGPDASTCHHRELAERLAERDGGDPACRRAAEQLAELYEQSRYAPPGGPLSPEELADARRALCFLAGVTAP